MANTTEFLPFHAINEFMRPDFRLSIIRETLSTHTGVAELYINDLSQQIKTKVKVPGFRNSDKAPALVKVVPTSKAFEKYPDLVAALLSCWAEIQSELRQQVYELLKSRKWPLFPEGESIDIAAINMDLIKEWPIFPITINRAKLPGFFIHWPKGEDFETLYTNFTTLYPESDASIDKVSLMTVWLTMRLPYKVDTGIEDPAAAENIN